MGASYSQVHVVKLCCLTLTEWWWLIGVYVSSVCPAIVCPQLAVLHRVIDSVVIILLSAHYSDR